MQTQPEIPVTAWNRSMTPLAQMFAPRPDARKSDWYKFRMAEIGAPLRKETFALAIRKKGPHYIPFDPEEFVQSLLPDPNTIDEARAYVEGTMGLHLTDAAWAGLLSEVEVVGVPKGTWVADRETTLTVTGPQILVSWLEARLIGQATFLINVATIIMRDPIDEVKRRLTIVAVEREAEMIRAVWESLKGNTHFPFEIEVRTEEYYQYVLGRAKQLIAAVGGDPKRMVESGYRACPCDEVHMVAVAACKEAGFIATSDVYAASQLGMTPFGTTGHEHTSRSGADYTAFSDAVDRTDKPTTMLLDTYSTIHSGIPSAIEVLRRRPTLKLSTRLDSETTMVKDYLYLVTILRENTGKFVTPSIGLGGGFGVDETIKFEALREQMQWPASLQSYQSGQWVNEYPWPLPTRGDVGAVYKLAWVDGTPRRKHSDDPRKGSIGGQSVVWRLTNPGGADRQHMPVTIIGQQGEETTPGYVCISGLKELPPYCRMDYREFSARIKEHPPRFSPQTEALHAKLEADRLRWIAEAVAFEVSRG